MSHYDDLQKNLNENPKVWLITGVAGFIGSNLLEKLLKLNQWVVGLDNLSTGHKRNLEQVRANVTREQWLNFNFIEGDICNVADCERAMSWEVNSKNSEILDQKSKTAMKVDYILHQAALGSVPRSIEDPLRTNNANVTGFLNMLDTARKYNVERFVYAASSSTYGDHPALPKVEDKIGKPLSPYAVTKLVNEIYAGVYAECYGLRCIGLRYFNVFGPRQDPAGAYAAVIPKWLASLVKNDPVEVNGDGETSRDFCYVDNAVQANILAAVAKDEAVNHVYNIAFGGRTSLNELYEILCRELKSSGHISVSKLQYSNFRAGDVRHSQADISKARELLGYDPAYAVECGIAELVRWYLQIAAPALEREN